MIGTVLALITLIIFAVVAVYKEKYGNRDKMRKCMNDPFYAYFFEDVRDFKYLARINGYTYWHNKKDDCIISDPFNDEDIRRLSRYLTPAGEKLYSASEALNISVYNQSFNTTVYDSDEVREFNKKLRDLACQHLKRFGNFLTKNDN